MTIRHHREIETLSLVILAAVLGTMFALMTKSPKAKMINLPVIAPLQATSTTPTPTSLPKPMSFSQTSPDGVQVLTMVESSNKDQSKTFTFSITDNATNTTKQIYHVTLSDETMSIPSNAFSPDNRYVFVQNNRKNGIQAWVMRTDGQPINITTNEQYYNVTSLFTQKMPDVTYDTTTGWASETLLIILTKNSNGSEGTSYWFEVPSKAIIPLATEF
jgi:hypothetical protein